MLQKIRNYPASKINYLFEVLTAIILSLSTVFSAWSVYQSGSWHNVEKDLIFNASQHRAESNRYLTSAMQFTAIDVGMFLEFAQAYSKGDTKFSDFIYHRFRPEMRTAVDAWMALNPLVNPDAPAAPFYMEEYILDDEIKAEEYSQHADEKIHQAELAYQNSDTYSKMTVLFASTLFFAGITTKFESNKIRMLLLFFAILSFIIGLIIVATSPII